MKTEIEQFIKKLNDIEQNLKDENSNSRSYYKNSKTHKRRS